MPFSQKYTIIQLFEDTPEGTQFTASSWPLHATIVDTFAIDWDVATMTQQLQALLQNVQPFESHALRQVSLGPNRETPVILLEKTDELVRLHYAITDMLSGGSLKLNEPGFAHDGFLPHATIQKHATLHPGDTVLFSALSIIDMFPDGDPYARKVLKTMFFGSQPSRA